MSLARTDSGLSIKSRYSISFTDTYSVEVKSPQRKAPSIHSAVKHFIKQKKTVYFTEEAPIVYSYPREKVESKKFYQILRKLKRIFKKQEEHDSVV
jgi:hypothetical protein